MLARKLEAMADPEAGVPGGEAYVMSDAGLPELADALRNGKTPDGKRVRAAPTFSLRVGNSAHTFSGAQEREAWLEMLEQVSDFAAEAGAKAARAE